MERACYSVELFHNHWIVSVFGTRILTCKTKRTAVDTARRASLLLNQHEQQPGGAALPGAAQPEGDA
jgi:hypothetical protein